MPYRRLPNTDKARLRALEKALSKLEAGSSEPAPFSASTSQTLRNFVPRFQNALILLDLARKKQTGSSPEYLETLRKARMYVSHFVQVMNMAISRGEQKAVIRKFYGLEGYDSSLPPLNSETDLLRWGKKIIEGDRERVSIGGSPFYNPSIALVKVNFEKFYEAYHFQKKLQQNTGRNSNLVNDLRNEADQLIQKIWNETEDSFVHLSDEAKRDKAKQYGVVYVFRKSEIKKVEPEKPRVYAMQQELVF